MKNALFLLVFLLPFSIYSQDLSAKLAAKDMYGRGLFGTSQQRLGGWSLIATNPMTPSYSNVGSGSNYSITFKVAHKATANAAQLRLVYANYANIQAGTYQENYNPMFITGSLQKMGTGGVTDQTGYIQRTIFQNGSQFLHIMPGTLAYTLPLGFGVTKNETFYTLNHRNLYQPPAPSAPPSLTALSTGGTLNTSASFWVCYSYVFRDGFESATSTATQATTPSGSNAGSISVSPPTVVASAVGYRCYMTVRNNTQTNLYSRATDIVPFTANATITQEISNNANAYVRQGGQLYYVGGNGTAGGTNYDGLNTGEGLGIGDYTNQLQTNYISNQANSYIYSPVAILGRTTTPQKTVAIIGTSIAAGTGDMGYVYNSGGFSTRALTNQMALSYNPAIDPLYAYVRVPLGSSKILDFANFLNTNNYNRNWLEITELATNVISDYGTNDLSSGLSAIKTATLNLAAYYMSRSIKYYSCTIIPKTNSTDGWQTVTNQTTQGTTIETTRTGFNAWLRDPTASGFMAQANAQAGTTGLADFIDVCKYLEVNSSNVLTQDGGFWRIPTGVSEVTGTVSTANNYQWTVSNTFTANQYKGWSFVVTSGAATGKQGCILWNSTNIINISTTISTNTASGDSYKITLLSTIDGTHPSTQGHIWMAQAVQERLNTLQF